MSWAIWSGVKVPTRLLLVFVAFRKPTSDELVLASLRWTLGGASLKAASTLRRFQQSMSASTRCVEHERFTSDCFLMKQMSLPECLEHQFVKSGRTASLKRPKRTSCT